MGPYTATKAGVEAFTDTLRMESAPSGARVGCAYFGFIDTDLVRASSTQRPAEILNSQSPAFLRNPAPLSSAVDAIERGIERRAPRLWAPRWVGVAVALGGILQPLTERRIMRDQAQLGEAVRLADPASGNVPEADPLLGVSAPSDHSARENSHIAIAEHHQPEDRDHGGLEPEWARASRTT